MPITVRARGAVAICARSAVLYRLGPSHLVADGVHNGHSVAVGGCPAGARVPGARAAGTCWTAASWPLAGAGAERGSGSGRGPARPDRRMPSPLPGQPLGVAGVVALREMGEHEQ